MAFDDAWFNDAFLIPGKRKPIVVCVETREVKVLKKILVNKMKVFEFGMLQDVNMICVGPKG